MKALYDSKRIATNLFEVYDVHNVQHNVIDVGQWKCLFAPKYLSVKKINVEL